eukprot:scaffold1203_cov74-Phaeocystis_antarctica.AAC.10
MSRPPTGRWEARAVHAALGDSVALRELSACETFGVASLAPSATATVASAGSSAFGVVASSTLEFARITSGVVASSTSASLEPRRDKRGRGAELLRTTARRAPFRPAAACGAASFACQDRSAVGLHEPLRDCGDLCIDCAREPLRDCVAGCTAGCTALLACGATPSSAPMGGRGGRGGAAPLATSTLPLRELVATLSAKLSVSLGLREPRRGEARRSTGREPRRVGEAGGDGVPLGLHEAVRCRPLDFAMRLSGSGIAPTWSGSGLG